MSVVFIGLPVYNGDNFLEQALKSIRSQDYTNFRLLISDNASTDKTQEIAQRHAAADPRITYVRHPDNMGAAPNFNYCLKHAEGKYFKWMAHDDLLRPKYLSKCVEALESDPDVVVAHSNIIWIDEMGRETGVCDTEISLEEPDAVARFKRAMPINHGVAGIFGVMRLDILKGTPGIASFVGSDRCLLAELALYGRVHYVPDRVFLWRQHQHQSLQFTRHERMKWFDPRSNKVLGSLYVRRFIAAQGAILRSPLSPMDKLRAFAQTLIWMTSNIGLLFRDARFLGGIMLRKASLRRSKA